MDLDAVTIALAIFGLWFICGAVAVFMVNFSLGRAGAEAATTKANFGALIFGPYAIAMFWAVFAHSLGKRQ